VVRLDGGDPSAQVGIERLSVEKNVRKEVAAKETFTGSTTVRNTVEVSFKKYGSSVRIVPISPLAKGEYALWVNEVAYLFGVD
jgi:hypothetical protein